MNYEGINYLRHAYTTKLTTNKDNVVEGYTNQHVHHNGGHGSSHIFCGTSMRFCLLCSQCQWVSGCKDGDNVPLK